MVPPIRLLYLLIIILGTTESVTVNGEIRFPKKLGKLEDKSCLHVAFQDQSIMDGSSVTIEEKVYDLSKYTPSAYFIYMMIIKLKTRDGRGADRGGSKWGF